MPSFHKSLAIIVALVTAIVCLTSIVSSSASAAAAGCARYASPSGSDSASGSASSPVQSISVLENLLSPGQTGCLEHGKYGSHHSSFTLAKSGTADGQITVTAAPGQSVTVIGYIDIAGAYITLSGLNIDDANDLAKSSETGTGCPHPISDALEINGHNDIFEHNNYYQSIASLRANGIGVGWNGQADNTIIRYNRIHDVGQCQDFDHLIYLSHGTNVQIYDNWMWNDPHGWGVQIYPAASGADVYNNVIDSAGSGFVIGGGSAVSNNTIKHNIVINSTGLRQAGLKRGVAISGCCGVGSDDSFADNISDGNPGGVGAAPGVSLAHNTSFHPTFANAAKHDYRSTSAALASWHLWNGQS